MPDKSQISNAKSYQEIGAFWDENDATEKGDQDEVEFQVNITSQKRYYPVDVLLSEELKQLARDRGISEETLLNLWIKEKIDQIKISS